MLSRSEFREHRKNRSTIWGMGKRVIWWLHRIKKKILFHLVKTVARQGHHEVQSRALPGLVHYRLPGIIFLGKGWPTLKAHATGPLMRSRNRFAFSPLTAAVIPVPLRCSDLPWPTRCSRDTAKVAVFRLASSHPGPEPVLPSGRLS